MQSLQTSDDDVIAQATDILASCNPPIALGNLEPGDDSVGRRILALIECIKTGNAILNTKRMPAMILRERLNGALASIAGKSQPPSFRIEDINSNKGEVIKLLRWIVTKAPTSPVKAIPTYVAWAVRVGAIESNSAPAITRTTVLALAQRFGLRGEPFEAFRKAGVMIPDDPNQAVAVIFKAANGRGPDAVRFVYDDESEAEISRIESVMLNLKIRPLGELTSRISEIEDTLQAIERLKAKLSQVPVTKSLKQRTEDILCVKDLENLKRKVEMHVRSERQRGEAADKKALEVFESKVCALEEAIVNTRALVERRRPDTIVLIRGRIESLTLEAAESSLKIVESDRKCTEARIAPFRSRLLELTDIVRRKRQELEDYVCVTQATKRSNHQALFTHLQMGLKEVEARIEGRIGSYKERVDLIQCQKKILGRHDFRIKQEGIPLDEDLRNHCIHDFIPIADLSHEVARLREKCESVLCEEREIENRRMRFVDASMQGNSNCRLIEQGIAAFTFNSLGIVRRQKIKLYEWRTSLKDHCMELDDSWGKLCELRLMPGQESVDAIHEWTTRLIVLCDSTLVQVDIAIPQLEDAKISLFLSTLASCQTAQRDADARFQTLSHDPFTRIDPLRQLTNELSHHHTQLKNCYTDLRIHELESRISDEDHESVNQFGKYREPYDSETARLSSYLSSVQSFHTLTRFVRFAIPDMAVQYDRHCNPSAPRLNIYIANDICDSVSAQLDRLDRLLHTIHGLSPEWDSPAPSSFDQTRDELRREFLRVSTSIQHLATHPNPHFVSMEIKLRRDQVLEDFIEFADENYSLYTGQRFSVKYYDEIGIDCGGLTRELFTVVAKPLFNRAFIISGNGDLLWLPQASECSEGRLKDLLAAGFLIRLALDIEEPLVAPLSIPLFRVMKGEELTSLDLQIIHPETAASLVSIQNSLAQGEASNVYLKDGREVTEQLFSQFEYEQRASLMVESVSEATMAFRKGFQAGIHITHPNLSAEILHQIVMRDPILDWGTMKTKCRLSGYSANDVPIVLFWKVFDEMPEQQKLEMLIFITGSDRPPGKGFEEMPIMILNTEWLGVGKGPIPTAATCFRRLSLPEITDEAEMRLMLQICTEWHHGFHRS
jgi:hypothetical protein